MKKTKTQKSIRPINLRNSATTGVAVLALASFAMSFEALRGIAMANGMSAWAATLFPLSIDLAILVYSLASVVRRFQSLPAKMEMAFVASVTLASIILNVMSGAAPGPVLHTIVHAAPPVCLAMAVEATTRMLSARSDRRKATKKAKG